LAGDVEIKAISKSEFMSQASNKRGAKLQPESKAVIELKKGTGIKFPCRWKHRGKHGTCFGSASLRAAAKRYGQTTNFRCKEGTVYVWREE
jgi:hypothetical protein